MTIEEFGKTIKEKYPQYGDKSDLEIGEAMLRKYPTYQSKITGVSVSKKETPFKEYQISDGKMINRETGMEDQEEEKLKISEVAKKTAGFYKESLIGGAKGIAKSITGLASLPQQAGRFAAEKITGKPAPEEFRTVREMADEKKILEPEGAIQKGAMAGEQLAEFFTPGGLTKLAKSKGLLTKVGLEALGFGTITAAQEGEVGKEAGVSAAIGAVVPLVGTGLKVAKGKYDLKKVKEASKEVNDLVGAISQGKIKDISKAREALSNINIKGIKTYQDLSQSLDSKIVVMAKNLDKFLGTKPEKIVLKNLTKSEKVKDKVIMHNYVDDAINQLDELYKKTNDPVGVETMKQLKNKASIEGITIKEIIDIAKKYGNEFSSKAFIKATGDPLTSVNAQAFENTRKGIKSTARGLFGDDAYKAVDEEMGKIINTKKLTKKVSENVNKLKQRIGKRGLGEKAGRAAFNLIDTLSGRTASGFMRAGFIPRGGGLKTLNALDLENALKKNLNKLGRFEKILSKTKNEELTPVVERIIKGLSAGYLQRRKKD